MTSRETVSTTLALHNKRLEFLEAVFLEGLRWVRGIAVGVGIGVILLAISIFRAKGA